MSSNAIIANIKAANNTLFLNAVNVEISNNLIVNGDASINNLDVSGNLNITIESVNYTNLLTPQNVFQPFVPPGAVMSFATKGAPQGWLECNGQILSRSSYQNLFNVIGTTWGSGDGSTTFNLPNLNSGYFIRGGNVDGNLMSFTTARPNGFSATTADNGAHAHGIELADLGGIGGTRFKSSSAHIYSHVPNYYAGTMGVGDHNHTVNITGWDTETAPKHVILLYCIKY
jgi:microcystin-dependent protein